MTDAAHAFIIRPATVADTRPLCVLLNTIIRIGGTTAMEQPLSEATFGEWFIHGPRVLSCLMAEDATTGLVLGFQALDRHPELPDRWADIATFARPEPKVPGVGTALFAATRSRARELGLVVINATIRADNTGGLAFYTKMGFQDYNIAKAQPLADGTPVDRYFKRYRIA